LYSGPEYSQSVTDEYLATVLSSGVPPYVLTLKKNTAALLIMNLAPDDGLTNGTKLIIDEIVSPALLKVRARNPNTGELTCAYVPCMRFNFKLHRTNTSVVRTQFPVLPAYAITCNHAQCQTLDFTTPPYPSSRTAASSSVARSRRRKRRNLRRQRQSCAGRQRRCMCRQCPS
jgi:hypothetical protein